MNRRTTQQFSPTGTSGRRKLTSLVLTVTFLCLCGISTQATVQLAYAAETVQDAAATARKLQLEGTRLQLQGHLEEAVKKYQESISSNPNPKLSALVEKLEKKIAKTPQEPVGVPVTTEHTPTVVTEDQPAAPDAGQEGVDLDQPQAEALIQETTTAAPEPGTEKEVARETAVQVQPGGEEVVEQIQKQVIIERSPGTPEQELIYAFTDWMLGFFPYVSPDTGFGLETNRNYAITSKEEQFEVILSPFVFHIDELSRLDFNRLTLVFQPKGIDKLEVHIQLPSKVLSKNGDEILAEIRIGRQDISGVWDRTLHSFEKSKLELGDIIVQDPDKRGRLDIKEMQFGNLLSSNAQGIWEEEYHAGLNGLSFVEDDDNFAIQHIAVQSSQGGSNFDRYIELRKNIIAMADKADNMELAEAKVFFSSLDDFIQLFNSSASKISIQGITVQVDGNMTLDSLEMSGGLQKDAQTNKYIFNSDGEAKGFSFTEKGGQENNQLVSVSIDQVGFADRADINQIPKNLFVDLFTTIEGAEKVDEQEADAYLASHGMDFSKKILGLIKGYSAEINLNGLNVVNVMPTPVTLDTAKIGAGFDAGSGAGGKVNALISFSGFNGMDQGANNIPEAAHLNLELKNIPSLLSLISDPTSLVEGDMDKLQGQVMMNGMGAFMSSALALSMTDSFIAFPASRFNFNFMANVDNTAKFFSTGNLKISVENPDDFMRILQSFGTDPGMQQMLATITALANRTDEKGEVIDSIDARITQDGKIVINAKDVTNMFFPEPAPAPAAGATEVEQPQDAGQGTEAPAPTETTPAPQG